MVSKSVQSRYEGQEEWPNLEIDNPEHYIGRFFGKDYRGLIRNEMWLMIVPKDSPI